MLFAEQGPLSEAEHRHSMFVLRALETQEQRNRADSISYETKGLPTARRLRLAKQFLLPPLSHLVSEIWSKALDAQLGREFPGF